MIYIKYVFLITIFALSSLTGILLSKKFKNRVNELREIKEYLNIIENKIRFTYKPIKDIFYELSKNDNIISEIFKNAYFNLKNNDVKTSLEKALNDSKSILSLNEEDINIVKGLGKFLR